MENKKLLRKMVELGYNELYLELEDETNVSIVLQDNFGMTKEEVANFEFDVANEILEVSMNPTKAVKQKKDEVKQMLEKTEMYQLWIAVMMISLFGISIMLLIFQPIPDANNDLLVVLATWLGKDVSLMVQYHHGTSYSSLLKTKSMIRTEHENFTPRREANHDLRRQNRVGRDF